MNEAKTPRTTNKLKIPEGVSSTGPFVDMQEAYVKSVVAIPAVLQVIVEILNEIADSLNLLSIYLEKKGIAEGTFTNEDLDENPDESA